MKTVKGLIVIYVNIGNLPPFKGEAYVRRFEEQIVPNLERSLNEYDLIIIPIRHEETRVEYIPF